MGCCAWCNFMDLCAGWGSREQGVRSVVPVVNRSGACGDSMDPRQCRLVSLPSVLFGWFRKDLQKLRFLRLVAQAADANEYMPRAVEMPQFIVEVSWMDLFKLIQKYIVHHYESTVAVHICLQMYFVECVNLGS